MDIKKFLADYVAFRSVSCENSAAADMQAARDFLIKFLLGIGLHAREVKTELHSVILAKNLHRAGQKTVLLYGHYDVQPEGDGWSSPPFTLTERNGRLYARGASDNKGGNATILAALHDVLTENGDIPLNITVVLEGEEEIGSPSMAKFLREYGDELQADFAVVADTWSIDDENIVVTTGLRGIVGFEVKLKSAEHDIHSGYGGSIINPIRELAKLCASFSDHSGRISIPGFYDDVEPPSNFEREQIELLPFDDGKFLESIRAKKLSTDTMPRSAIGSMRFQPTMEFNGIAGGYGGAGIKTIIPSEASAKISCRIVANQNCENVKKCIREAILARVDKNLEVSINFEKCSNAYNLPIERIRADGNSTIGHALKIVDREIGDIFGHGPLYLREGGSIALIRLMKDTLGIDSILMGLSSSRDCIHAADESISIKMLERGREFFRHFLTKLST
jgi:acetylornithine deacetylase/succinyl-diaminopimelate desuccinylase-like protein